jgi:hypothetical protein
MRSTLPEGNRANWVTSIKVWLYTSLDNTVLGLPAVVVSNDREVVSDANWLAWTTMLAFRRYRVWRCRLEVEASRLFC